MKVDGETKEAVFLGRLKRFSALVQLGGKKKLPIYPIRGGFGSFFRPVRRYCW